jgi:hypothetical protein
LRRADAVRRPERLPDSRRDLAQDPPHFPWLRGSALDALNAVEYPRQRRGILLPVAVLSREHGRPDLAARAVHAEAHDCRLVPARERRHALLGDGVPEPFRQLRARAPRRRRLLVQPEGDGQARLGRDACRTPQVHFQPRAGKESHDFHEIMPRAEPERAAFPLGEPDIGPRQIVVDDALHPGEIEPLRRDVCSD